MMKSQKQMQDEEEFDLSETVFAEQKNQVNVRAIAIAVAIVVVILVIVYFIKTYANQKVYITKILNDEISSIETGLQNTLHFNNYILDILSDQIKENPKNYNKINNILKFYHRTSKSQNYLTRDDPRLVWQEFLWINSDAKKKVSSLEGIIDRPNGISRSTLEYSRKKSGKKIYWSDAILKNGQSTIYSLTGVRSNTDKFLGNMVISINGEELIKSLSKHKINNFTNFVIFDREYKPIGYSRDVIASAGIFEGKIANETTKANLSEISPKDLSNNSRSFIDMMNGINYVIKKTEKQPFIILVSVNKAEISQMMYNSVIIKFIEIAIFASMFLILIVTIYKRETWFRTRAEKAYARAQKEKKAKSDFLAFTAHEIRSPLGFIMTGSEIMCKKMFGPISDKYMDYLNGIHNSSKIILDFIDDILNEEQILAGNFKIVESYFSIEEIIQEAIKLNKSRYLHKEVTIKLEMQKNLPELYCDSRRIVQVFNNIISNSIKYTNGNPEIDIDVSLKNGDLVAIVRDYGVGMNEEEIKIALTKFGIVQQRQAHTSLIQQFGLGLAIVKLLLDAHEATFQIESQVNIGTKVTITFPSERLKNITKTKSGKKVANEKK